MFRPRHRTAWLASKRSDCELHVFASKEGLQPGVNMPGSAAFRGIAGDIYKIGFLVATGTFFRWLNRGDGVLASAAAPVGHVALRADVSHESP
jgi:hypothetical protein